MPTPLLARVRARLWDRAPSSAAERQLMMLGRYAVVMARDLMDGQLSMRAMSLVYTTLLSLVPVLALGFSLFKALGIHNALEPVLLNLLSPLGAQGVDLTRNIIAFVENIKVGVLGSLGVGLLFYTVLSMLQKIESSFNYVWRIEAVRGLGQRFGEYLSVVIVGPVLVFSALGITGTVMSSSVMTRLTEIQPFGLLIYLAGKLVPYLLIIAAFTFLYIFIPNTRVRFRAALAGGILAGVLWQSGSAAFATFVAQSPNYNAVYSGFAIVILLLIWLYLGWLILLTGCQLSYYVQHPEQLTPTRVAPHLSGKLTEWIGLQVMAVVGRRFLAGEPAPSRLDLHRSLAARPEHVDSVVEILLHHGVLAQAGDDVARLLPARDLESITVAELWRRLRTGFDGEASPPGDGAAGDAQALLEDAERAFAQSGGARTLRQWLGDGARPGSQETRPGL